MRYLLYLLFLFVQCCCIELNCQNVTNLPHRFDGFGAQFLVIIGSVFYAESNNLKFVYTPFTSMEHNYAQDVDFLQKKEWLINFIGNFELNTALNILVPANPIDCFFSEERMTKFAQSQSLKKIKNCFRANKDIDNYFNNNNLNIVIHVRRHNPHDNRIYGTDTPDQFFLSIINKLRVIYASKNPLFHICSQGDVQAFKEYKASDTVLHLNESIEDSFVLMVLADVLVTSISTFSYTAGLLSDGTIYYIPFECFGLPHWKSTNILLP